MTSRNLFADEPATTTAPDEDAAHAVLGASTAARWIACAGSVRLSKGMPSVASYAADEGSAAHWLAEKCLVPTAKYPPEPLDWLAEKCLVPTAKYPPEPLDFVGTIFQGKNEIVEITEEMAEHVKLYVDHVRDRLTLAGKGKGNVTWGVERKFSLARLNPPEPMFGTTDFWLYDGNDYTLYVDDLKYGAGVMVEIIGNIQTRYYALGALLHLAPETRVDRVVMTIVQPRKDHEHGFIRSETITALELREFAITLIKAAEATQDPNAPLVVGEHCRFCPAKPICPALAAESMAVAQMEFDTPVLPPVPETLSTETLSEYLTKLPILDDWSKAVKAHAAHLLRIGVDVPGFKLVERRAERKWKNPLAAAAAAQNVLDVHGKDAAYLFETPALKSVAQIEKLFRGKKKFETALGAHVTKASAGTKLVPDSDARPAVVLTRGEEFSALPAPGSDINEGEKKETVNE